jgi:hypothetical protein
MRYFGWLFSRRRSDLGVENPHGESRGAEYCQLPGGEWAIKRELTLPTSTDHLFLTVRLPKGTRVERLEMPYGVVIGRVQ